MEKLLPRLMDGLSRSLTLRKLEWLGILAPLVFLVLYHYLMVGPGHGLFHSVWGLLLLITLLGMTITVFSRLMFRAIVQLQRNVEKLSQLSASQNAQLRALNEANLALSEEKIVSSVLQRVVDLSRELVQAKYAALSVVGENGDIKAFLTSGLDDNTREAIGALPSGKGLLGLMLRSTEPVRLNNINEHPDSEGFPPDHPRMTTFLGVPIRYKGQAVGGLYLTEKSGGEPFTTEDEEVVELFANQAAVAIQNTRLYEQVQAIAVETERTRISREMHDGLAQVLGYVNTKAQAVDAFLENGEVMEAQVQVRELSQAARQIYQDVREGILALGTQIGPERGLRAVLEEYISEYEIRLQRPVRVSWNFGAEEMDLGPLREIQLLRIVQEALTNIRKHAEATEVTLNFIALDGNLEIEIIDNGKGFNPLAIQRGDWPHLGLQIMQERAESIGGAFEIDSAPARGTVVRVRVPGAVYTRASEEAS